MINFYIKKIVVSGEKVLDSTIEFTEGLNIIKGPSNTGKTTVMRCIDYFFGSDKVPFSDNGYTLLRMTVATAKGDIFLSREIGDNTTIKVNSQNPDITSGNYGIKTASNKKPLTINDDFWLKLIGVNNKVELNNDENFKKKRLTWRSMLHLFMLTKESRVKGSSIIFKGITGTSTYELCILYFLLTGNDFSQGITQDSDEMKKAKKKAVLQYISERLLKFKQRRDELGEVPLENAEDVENRVKELVSEIAEIEHEIECTDGKARKILDELYVLNERLTECNTLSSRYVALKTRYLSDVKRLEFIIEGETQLKSVIKNNKCPFCENEITERAKSKYIEASASELNLIKLQLSDLNEAESELKSERAKIENAIVTLSSQKEEVEAIISKKLKPKSQTLNASLAAYRKYLLQKSELEAIDRFEKSMNDDYYEKVQDDDSKILFKIKNHFTLDIMDRIDAYLIKILSAFNFPKALTAHLNTNSFDIVVNGNSKDTYSEGYTAILNTAVALSIFEYLDDIGTYKPGILVIDCPILPLNEVKNIEEATGIKNGVFQYLLNNQGKGQIIILEQEIPSFNYAEKANLITFTMLEDEGRYGFLTSVRNDK